MIRLKCVLAAALVCASPLLSQSPPPIPREFRGVWVATVGNMDWPSRPGLSTAQQQNELRAILDRALALHLNAIVFQVRPMADALYASRLEPWSEFLTGVQGRAPSPYYDPLQFAVAEAHARGLELHAWINPFRARFTGLNRPAAATHVTRANRAWVRTYGRQTWMDPSEPGVRERALAVVRDIITRYDVDGIHIDDYFYPEVVHERGHLVQFPDLRNYERYQRNGGRLSRNDWRRKNVDDFVRDLYRVAHETRPTIRVGVSPAGIWRPGYPTQIRGRDVYVEIFADSRKWLNDGWLDYFVPQLYWPIAQTAQSFPVLLRWWSDENHEHRHLYSGLFTSQVTSARPWPASEIAAQIESTRAEPGAAGHVHFSMQPLMRVGTALDSAMMLEYTEPALIPSYPWLDRTPPSAPRLALTGDRDDRVVLHIDDGGREHAARWAIQLFRDGQWRTLIVPASQNDVILAQRGASRPDRISVIAVDALGNASAPAIAIPPRR